MPRRLWTVLSRVLVPAVLLLMLASPAGAGPGPVSSCPSAGSTVDDVYIPDAGSWVESPIDFAAPAGARVTRIQLSVLITGPQGGYTPFPDLDDLDVELTNASGSLSVSLDYELASTWITDAFDGEPAAQTWRVRARTTGDAEGIIRYWTLWVCYEGGETRCRRADVSTVIYGGWDGIPVKAYVGGTEQPTMYTTRDGFGLPAVLWTFYPPASGWDVSVAPQLPAGLDPARWQYKLVAIRSGYPYATDYSPAGAGTTITPCSERVFYFQLVDTGALP